MACYAQVPFSRSDLHGIVQAIRQIRSFSDLSEIYEARVHWQAALREVESGPGEAGYLNDLAMHDALKREHQSFRDVHVAYVPPACYWNVVDAFIPFDFGSTLRRGPLGREQIVFIEGVPVLPEVYRDLTGIDTAPFVGQRVLSINGVPVLDYFRAYAEAKKTHTDAGGELNGILGAFEYAVRLGGPSDFVPDRASDTFVFEAADGQRSQVELPWAFTLTQALAPALGLPPTASTEEFVQLCEQGPPLPPGSDATAQASALARLGAAASRASLTDPREIDRHRQRMVRKLRESAPPRPVSSSYFEVPPEQLGKDLVEIIPPTDNARVVQYGDQVTALQLGDTQAWIDVARQGIDYACEHSQRLIIDVRFNGGGNDTVIRWLHHYLFPANGERVEAGLLPLRLRNDNPVFNEILAKSADFAERFLPDSDLDPCAAFVTPGCLLEVRTAEPLSLSSPLDWVSSPSRTERRGGRPVSLSRLVGLPNIGNPEFDSASCAGRFAGDNLVIVTNGANASGGYFLPSAFKGDAVIVNTGGFVREPMAMGRARGGATITGGLWSEIAQGLPLLTNGELRIEQEVFGFPRPVDSQMEMLGAYRKDRRTLHLDEPVEADLHVNVWTSVPGSEGFIYERVLRAVDEQHPR